MILKIQLFCYTYQNPLEHKLNWNVHLSQTKSPEVSMASLSKVGECHLFPAVSKVHNFHPQYVVWDSWLKELFVSLFSKKLAQLCLAEGQAGIRKSLRYHPSNCQLVTGVQHKKSGKQASKGWCGPGCWGSIHRGPHTFLHLLGKSAFCDGQRWGCRSYL